MGRRPYTNPSKYDLTAYAYPGEIEEIMAFRLSKTHLSHVGRKASSASKKISLKEDLQQAKTSGSHSPLVNNSAYPPAIPLRVYRWVQDAIEIMNRPGWPNGGKDEDELDTLEGKIDAICRIYGSRMPAGWKYERQKASSLIAGYDRVFKEDGHKYII